MTAPSLAHQSQSMNTPTPPPHEQALLTILSNMEELTALYKTELDILELRDMQKFAEIQPEKNRLVQSCEIHMNQILEQTAFLKTVSPAMKERIFIAENNLRDLASQSRRACEIRAASVKRVQDRLLDAARHILNRDKTLYDKQGKTADTSKTKPIATAINEAI
jgi:hypothetical protein